MKAYIMYFDAPCEWNDVDLEHRNKWVVGEFDGYRYIGTLDGDVEVVGVFDDFDSARARLERLVQAAMVPK